MEWPPDKAGQELARELWHEALVIVYRLLLILCLEDAPEAARRFSFASTALWRGTYSPRSALPPVVRGVLDHHADTGSFLADGLRTLFDMFADGLRSLELRVDPLGGAIFGRDTTPLLSPLHWSERAVAVLLDKLLWTPAGRDQRQRVHYGSLDVEELGRVYEALLELVPGIADKPMCRLRRAKLEIVVPIAQGAAYRNNQPGDSEEDEADEDTDEDEGKSKTKVECIEDIPAGRYYLCDGLGRKATGSYYTPRAFVRFLLQETLSPQITARSTTPTRSPARSSASTSSILRWALATFSSRRAASSVGPGVEPVLSISTQKVQLFAIGSIAISLTRQPCNKGKVSTVLEEEVLST